MLSRSQVRRAGDREEAIAAYREREGAVLGTHHEVVLFYGESEDDLRRTHARYFDIAVMGDRLERLIERMSAAKPDAAART